MGFVTGLLSGAIAKGYDPTVALSRHGLTMDDLREPQRRMSLTGYAELYNTIVMDLDDESLGLSSIPARSGVFEFLTRSVLSSANLQEALLRASRFLRLVLPDMRVTLCDDGECALLEIRETSGDLCDREDRRRTFAFEWLLRLLHALSCWLIDCKIDLKHVSFPFDPPQHAGDYVYIYTANSTFGADWLAAEFDRSLLRYPVRRTDSDLDRFLQGAPGRISILYRRDRDIVRQVREVIAEALPTCPTLDDIASGLHMSPRSLQRRLALEGASIRSIRDGVRRETALLRLERSRDPISQIADDLGYSDSTAFYRAFHSWTEQSPNKFRASRRR